MKQSYSIEDVLKGKNSKQRAQILKDKLITTSASSSASKQNYETFERR